MMSDEMESMNAMRGPAIDLRAIRAPRALVMLTLTLLALEFLFGNIWSLWPGTMPTSVSQLFGSSAGSYGYLSAHAFVAVLLVISSIALIAFIYRLHRRPLLAVSVAGFLMIVFAALSGSALLETGNSDYSLLMAVFFLSAWTMNLMIAVRIRVLTRIGRYRAMRAAGSPPAA